VRGSSENLSQIEKSTSPSPVNRVPRRVKLDSEHYHALMKKEHPDWNFCPTCNASLSEAAQSSLFSILLSDRENKFIVSISLSPENGTGVVSPFSLDGTSKFPVWAEPAQIGSPMLARERLFEETIIQHVLPAFKYGLKVSKFTGKDSDQSAFTQLFMKYAQKEMSEKAFESFSPSPEIQSQMWMKEQPDGIGPPLPAEPQGGVVEKVGAINRLDTTETPLIAQRAVQEGEKPASQIVVPGMPNMAATGVVGFDRIFGGGIPKDRLTLLSGESGSGKSIFAIKFLLEGAKRQEPSILAISDGDPLEILEESEALGLPIVRAIEEKKVFLVIKDPQKEYSVKTADIYNSKNNSEFVEVIRRIARRNRVRRIVIDNLTSLISAGNLDVVRKRVSEITQTLADLHCTVLATGNLQHGSKNLTYYGVEEFFFSALISLKSSNIEGGLVRYLHVPKMKGIGHPLSKYVFEIQPQAGIAVTDPLKDYLASSRKRSTRSFVADSDAMESILKLLAAKLTQAPTWGAESQFNFLNSNLVPSTEVRPVPTTSNRQPTTSQYTLPLGGKEQGPLGLSKKIDSVPQVYTQRIGQGSRKTVEGKLPTAAADNPWSSILSEREENEGEGEITGSAVIKKDQTVVSAD